MYTFGSISLLFTMLWILEITDSYARYVVAVSETELTQCSEDISPAIRDYRLTFNALPEPLVVDHRMQWIRDVLEEATRDSEGLRIVSDEKVKGTRTEDAGSALA